MKNINQAERTRRTSTRKMNYSLQSPKFKLEIFLFWMHLFINSILWHAIYMKPIKFIAQKIRDLLLNCRNIIYVIQACRWQEIKYLKEKFIRKATVDKCRISERLAAQTSEMRDRAKSNSIKICFLHIVRTEYTNKMQFVWSRSFHVHATKYLAKVAEFPRTGSSRSGGLHRNPRTPK